MKTGPTLNPVLQVHTLLWFHVKPHDPETVPIPVNHSYPFFR